MMFLKGNVAPNATPKGAPTDLVGEVKEFLANLDLDNWFAKMGATPAGIAAMCFAAGFAIGFLFKRYFKFLFATAIIAVAIIMFLHTKNMVVIDWVALSQYIGFDVEQISISTAINTTWDWIKHNALVFVSTLSGFMIGYKLG